jgi:hypothetical protein
MTTCCNIFMDNIPPGQHKLPSRGEANGIRDWPTPQGQGNISPVPCRSHRNLRSLPDQADLQGLDDGRKVDRHVNQGMTEGVCKTPATIGGRSGGTVGGGNPRGLHTQSDS